MIQTNTELNLMLICAVQYFISPINISGVKCDKVVDFLKSGHIFYLQNFLLPCSLIHSVKHNRKLATTTALIL